MQNSKTRQEADQKREAAARHGLNADEILPEDQRRRSQPPDRSGAPPQVHQNRHGNPILLPGSAAITTKRIKFSGDSGKDIKQLIEQTGQGGPGSGYTWHHHADYDPKTGLGTVSLMPTADHQQYHIGGSAQKRATDHGGDPDSSAKYGYNNLQ
jgi:hypothetical protein